jgi:AcrR family transcriptional regulator
MSNNSKQQDREKRILDMAAALMIQHGYDKTTLGDIAEAAGISRGLLYLHFENKEKLFEALVYRETLQYTHTWLKRQEADPDGGMIAAMYRNALFAINSRPLMAALMRRDRRIFGSYLRKPDNLFHVYNAKSQWVETLRQLQDAGAVRQDIKPEMLATILDMLSYGLVSVDEMRATDGIPSFDETMEAIAILLDQALMPKDRGNASAGKEIIRNFATSILAQLEQTQVVKEAISIEASQSE